MTCWCLLWQDIPGSSYYTPSPQNWNRPFPQWATVLWKTNVFPSHSLDSHCELPMVSRLLKCKQLWRNAFDMKHILNSYWYFKFKFKTIRFFTFHLYILHLYINLASIHHFPILRIILSLCSVLLTTALVFKSIVSDMSTATPAFLSFLLSWNIFFYPFTFSLCASFNLRWVSWRPYVYMGLVFLSV